jgi:drug/metabolite transporter (DMT)-like permease
MQDSTPPRKTGPAPGRFAFAAALAGPALLAFGPWMVRLADVGPIASGFWRLALAAPLLLLLGRVAGKPLPRLPRAAWAMIAIGGLFFAADLAAWHSGIVRTKLANATLFANTTSFIFAIYGFIVARRWPGRNQGAAVILAVLGVGLLIGRSYQLSPQYFIGDLLCLLAGFFYTFYLVAVDRARDRLSPLPTLTITTLAGLLPLLGFAMLTGDRIWPHDWTPLLVLAISSQVIGQGMIVYAVGHLPPVVVGLALLSQPVIGSAIGWLAYGETLSTTDWIGAIAIGGALVLVRRPE